ncbi:outer membrane lipoprotein carrier protein LolA [Wandonia haliotis]
MRFLVVFFLLATTPFFAQDKSQSILNDLSKKIKSYKSFYVDFKATIKNTDTGINENTTGKGWVQGDKFHTVYGENTIISNGIKLWVVSKEDKAVYISSAGDEDEESLNPKKLMSIWENGFSSKYVKQEGSNHVINLYPKDPGKSEYHTIILKVSTSNDLKSVQVKMKDGTAMTYEMVKFDGNIDIPASKFVFDKRNYPGYQEVDN